MNAQLRRHAAVGAIAAVAALGIGGSSASASTITQSANVRPCVNTASPSCNAIGTFGAGTPVGMVCWIDGSWTTGAYGSNRWFLVRRSDGYEGFVHSSLVGGQTTVPSCSTQERVKAGLEAIKRVGQVTASSSDAALFASSDWAPGPYGEWSGDCKKLVYVAHYRAGKQLVGGDAWATFSYYWNRTSAKGGGYPRYGSLVGFKTYMPYGHIAVAVGGSRIVSTRGTDGQRLSNALLSTSSLPSYAGWVLP